MATTESIKVTAASLNRYLKKYLALRLVKAKGKSERQSLGEYFIVDMDSDCPISTDVDVRSWNAKAQETEAVVESFWDGTRKKALLERVSFELTRQDVFRSLYPGLVQGIQTIKANFVEVLASVAGSEMNSGAAK